MQQNETHKVQYHHHQQSARYRHNQQPLQPPPPPSPSPSQQPTQLWQPKPHDDVVFFYSTGTDHQELSALCQEYWFTGDDEAMSGIELDFLRTEATGKHFKCRDTFLFFARAIFASQGVFASENKTVALQCLRATPLQAKAMTGRPKRLRSGAATAEPGECVGSTPRHGTGWRHG